MLFWPSAARGKGCMGIKPCAMFHSSLSPENSTRRPRIRNVQSFLACQQGPSGHVWLRHVQIHCLHAKKTKDINSITILQQRYRCQIQQHYKPHKTFQRWEDTVKHSPCQTTGRSERVW